MDPVVTALAPLQGLSKPMRESVRASRWSRWWGGVPTRIVIAYAPGAKDDVADWHQQIRQTLEKRLQVGYRQTRHDPRRCLLVYEARVEDLVVEAHPAARRAKVVLADVFGKSAEPSFKIEAGELTQARVHLTPNKRYSRAQARAGIENSFTALMPGRWRATWDLKGGDTVTFELRPIMPTVVPHLPQPITDKNRMLIPLGIDEDGNEVYWNLSGTGPHLLVVGKTGTGKTVAINGAVMELARRGWEVMICDPKRIEFMGLRDWPNVSIVATSVIDMIATIKRAHDVMEERYEAIENGADESDFPKLFLVLDEYRNFHRQITTWYADNKVRGMPRQCEVFDWVAAIAEKGRSGGVHLVMGTQRPDADFLTGSMRDNFDSRLSLGRLSPQGAKMMWESAYLGISVPRKIRGRGTGITSNDRVAEVQVLWTPDPRKATRDNDLEDLKLLEYLKPAKPAHPRLEVELGEEFDIDGKKHTTWERVLEARLVPVGTATQPSARLSLTKPAPETDLVDDDYVDEGEIGDDDVADREQVVDERFEGYAPETRAAATSIEVGDLVLVDPDLDTWAVIEAVDTDPEDDSIQLAWRDDYGDAGDLGLSDTEIVALRHPVETVDDPVAR